MQGVIKIDDKTFTIENLNISKSAVYSQSVFSSNMYDIEVIFDSNSKQLYDFVFHNQNFDCEINYRFDRMVLTRCLFYDISEIGQTTIRYRINPSYFYIEELKDLIRMEKIKRLLEDAS